MAQAKEDAEYGVDDYPSSDEDRKKKLPKGKYWDGDLIDKFSDEMEDIILDLVKGVYWDDDDEDKQISKILNKILDQSQAKLEKVDRKDYKYWSDCMICAKKASKGKYRKHMKFFWEKAFDKMISVKVDTDELHVVLVVNCVFYG